METHEPNVYPTILEGVLRDFWSPFLDLGARSAIFWHLKMGTSAGRVSNQFLKIANFSSARGSFPIMIDRKLQNLHGATILQEKSQCLLQ